MVEILIGDLSADQLAKMIVQTIEGPTAAGIELDLAHTRAQLRRAMRARFAIKNNWIPTDKWFPVKVLEREKWRTSPQIDDWPGFLTKQYWFRYPDKRAAAVAAHLYDTTLAEHSAAFIERWAWQHGLRAQWPKDFPSWWYPGRTQLLVITARPKGGEL